MSPKKSLELYLIGLPTEKIKSERLPSNKQALKIFFFFHNVKKQTVRSSAKSAIQLISEHYEKFRVPTILTQNAERQLLTLHEKWVSICKNKKRQSETEIKKAEIFAEKLNSCFDITPKNILTLIQDDSVKDFYLSHKQGVFLRSKKNDLTIKGKK